ncbi:MAG: carboxypeptidase-like regulatory domain-containing protein [Gemmatimonadales bacterium]
MLRLLICLTVLGLVPGLVTAQQPTLAIRGIVRDAGGAPVAAAEVVVAGRTILTSTDGRFVLEGLSSGLYPLIIRKVGYAPIRAQVILTVNSVGELEYQLEEEVVRLPTVEVEGRRTGIYGSVGDTALRAAPGVRVQVMGARGGEMVTDSLGRFDFPEANRGQYLVRIIHPDYAEHRMLVELKPGEGRDLAIMLRPGRNLMSVASDVAVRDLRSRLAMGLSHERAGAEELERRGPILLCDLPRVRAFARDPRPKTVIINGTNVLADDGFDLLPMLCAWQANELELVEFGTHVCNDVTRTIPALLGIQCLGRERMVPRSLTGSGAIRTSGARYNGPYLVIWERR